MSTIPFSKHLRTLPQSTPTRHPSPNLTLHSNKQQRASRPVRSEHHLHKYTLHAVDQMITANISRNIGTCYHPIPTIPPPTPASSTNMCLLTISLIPQRAIKDSIGISGVFDILLAQDLNEYIPYPHIPHPQPLAQHTPYTPPTQHLSLLLTSYKTHQQTLSPSS